MDTGMYLVLCGENVREQKTCTCYHLDFSVNYQRFVPISDGLFLEIFKCLFNKHSPLTTCQMMDETRVALCGVVLFLYFYS